MTTALTDFVLGAIELAPAQRQLLMLPLCLSIAVVYKTMRCDSVREVPLESLVLWGTLVIGMYAVGIGLWVLYSIMV